MDRKKRLFQYQFPNYDDGFCKGNSPAILALSCSVELMWLNYSQVCTATWRQFSTLLMALFFNAGPCIVLESACSAELRRLKNSIAILLY